MPVGVIARLSVKPEARQAFEAAFSEYQRKVRTLEPGNRFFHLHKSREVPGAYVVMEQYADDAALMTHRDTGHYKAIPAIFGAFMAGPADIQVFDSVD